MKKQTYVRIICVEKESKMDYKTKHKPTREESEKLAEYFFKHDYVDRGMLKWQGYFLSDHISAMKKDKADKPEELKLQQSQNLISESLMISWQTKRPVHIQLNQLEHSVTVESVDGVCMGTEGNEFMIRVDDEHVTPLTLDEIRNVK